MRQVKKMIRFKATSTCKVPDLDIDAQPGDEVEIAEGYAKPRLQHNGSLGPSVISQLAPQLVAVDPSEIQDSIGGPKAEPVAAMPTVDGLVKAGVPEGVAEQLVAAALAAANSKLTSKVKALTKG